jgi:hypothetical protein
MENEERKEPVSPSKAPEYEAPRVERVLDADEIAREVLYAGVISISDIRPPG